MEELVRVGVLGPGRIVRRVMSDFHRARGVQLTAVASRDLFRAQAAAREYGAARAFGSYEELAAASDVDLVYIATPHNLHCEQALMMMRAGKHVLCEKPMAPSFGEVSRMVRCAREHGVFLMEAMWTRFFPACAQLRALLEAGEVGEVTHVWAEFNCAGYADLDPAGRALNPDLAGGALLDLGVYPLMAVTMALGWQPTRVQGLCERAHTGVDRRAAIQMQFASGATAQISCALDAMGQAREVIYGTRGAIEVPDFYHPTRLILRRQDGASVEYRFPDENEGHFREFEHAAHLIRAGRLESPLMPLAESLAVSSIMTDLLAEWSLAADANPPGR